MESPVPGRKEPTTLGRCEPVGLRPKLETPNERGESSPEETCGGGLEGYEDGEGGVRTRKIMAALKVTGVCGVVSVCAGGERGGERTIGSAGD